MDSNIRKIKSWLQQTNPSLKEIPLELDLIEQRIIDSLKFVDLIFLIEQLTNIKLEISNIDIEQIRTLNSIQKTFFANLEEV